ncbi:MAG: FAD-linked oxidase C-terminal domain-containing protein, partial [Nostocoides sp.]
ASRTAAACFSDVVGACEAVNEYMSAGARPSMLELMDGPTLDVVSRFRDLGLPLGTRALLLVQSDDQAQAVADLEEFARVCTRRGAIEVLVADDDAEGELLIQARRLVGPAHEALGAEMVDDVCVPRARLADLLRGIARIGEDHDVLVTCAGHAGDGNMHPSVVFDAADAAMTSRAQGAFGAVMQLGLDLGGTITGEHGIGLLKASWLEAELGPVGLRVHRAVKDALDPTHLLNPGKVLRSPS